MNIQITSRRSKVSQETHEHLRKELRNLEKFYDKITSCHVILSTEHVYKVVELIINIHGNTINAKAKAENLGKAIDDAIQKIKRQLKKSNQKLKCRKNNKEIKTTINTPEYEDEYIDEYS